VKPETLKNLVRGDLGFSAFLNLIFLRVVKVVIICLVLTMIVYLLWQGKFTLGSFLAGVVFGLVAFLIRNHFKHYSKDTAKNGSTAVVDQMDDITGSEENQPTASVKE
jgi:hypothetical protein